MKQNHDCLKENYRGKKFRKFFSSLSVRMTLKNKPSLIMLYIQRLEHPRSLY